MAETMTAHTELEAALASAGFAVDLLDRLPDVVFFAKDTAGVYVAANRTLVQRLGMTEKAALLGRTARDVFPAPLGERYLAQDLAVCRTGREIADLLELHLYPNRLEGWCVTSKVPIRGASGAVIGLAGTSRDVHAPAAESSMEELAEAVRHIRDHFDRPLRVADVAALAHLSEYRFARRIRAVFGLTPAQLVIKTRIDAARRMLQDTEETIGAIAQACGYCDQSALTRQFKVAVGLTPAQYRERATRRR
ncbi:MAG TPA: AraC family transcriptional regulator [Thermoanaerobaculaceae bacterium]|nr:AraC family transcriptional regulator [Thermoanaerobaculaceae bacterium]